jgi:hypothetical protein
MESIVLIGVLLVLGLSLALNLAFCVSFHRRFKAIRQGFFEFITPEKEGENSGLDDVMDSMATRIGHSAFNQVRSMVASTESADVRGRKAVDSAISHDLLGAANPVVAGLLDSMPGLKKVIARNPALADYALDKIMSRTNAEPTTGPAVPGGDNHNESTRISI